MTIRILRHGPVCEQQVGNACKLACVVRHECATDGPSGGGDPQICFADRVTLFFEVCANGDILILYRGVGPGDAKRCQEGHYASFVLNRIRALRSPDKQLSVDLEGDEDLGRRHGVQSPHRQRRFPAETEYDDVGVEKARHVLASVAVEARDRARRTTSRSGKRIIIRETTEQAQPACGVAVGPGASLHGFQDGGAVCLGLDALPHPLGYGFMLPPRGFLNVPGEGIFELYGERCHKPSMADSRRIRNPQTLSVTSS